MRKLRALVAEDNDVMRNLLMQMLKLTGLAEFQFTEARDGVEAAAKFSPDRMDILFVDWQMPKMTGIDLVRKVRALEKHKRIPIVMVTGQGKIGDIEEALDEAGADAYVSKPYTIEQLKRQLSGVVAGMP